MFSSHFFRLLFWCSHQFHQNTLPFFSSFAISNIWQKQCELIVFRSLINMKRSCSYAYYLVNTSRATRMLFREYYSVRIDFGEFLLLKVKKRVVVVFGMRFTRPIQLKLPIQNRPKVERVASITFSSHYRKCHFKNHVEH